jgi:hypothetical protein
MKWITSLLAILLVAVLDWLPFQGTDVATLEPAEALYVSLEEQVLVETDGGWFGRGETVEQAIADLKESSPGQVFLQTVDYLLLQEGSEEVLPALYSHLRSGCSVCRIEEKPDIEKASAYLRTHRPGMTLQHYRAGKKEIPILIMKEERAYLYE